MVRRDAFAGYHPTVNLAFFVLVFVCAMLLMEPVCLLLSLLPACGYDLWLHGGKAVRFGARAVLPAMVLAAVLNPAFSHAGITILAYFPSGNPLTLESILYGLAAAVLLAAVIVWCRCCAAVLTADKLVYLFGRVIPALSLVLALSLRQIPRCAAQLRTIRANRRGMGETCGGSGFVGRVRSGAKLLSILVTWCLENAIETADSMKGRGYGLPGRTAFALYRFTRRDGVLSAVLALALAGVCVGVGCGALYVRYYPSMRIGGAGALGAVCAACFALLCFLPLLLNGKEALTWRRLRSNI